MKFLLLIALMSNVFAKAKIECIDKLPETEKEEELAEKIFETNYPFGLWKNESKGGDDEIEETAFKIYVDQEKEVFGLFITAISMFGEFSTATTVSFCLLGKKTYFRNHIGDEDDSEDLEHEYFEFFVKNNSLFIAQEEYDPDFPNEEPEFNELKAAKIKIITEEDKDNDDEKKDKEK